MQSKNPAAPALALLSLDRPLIIGHRGYCSIAPENTLLSFSLALEAEPDLIELDYHQSKDGIPMVIHDDTFDRTTDGRTRWHRSRVKVADKTAAEIQTLDAGSWFGSRFAGTGVPRLTEALDFIVAGGGVPLVEHKSGSANTCVKLLRDHDWINKAVIISFDWPYLREFHRLEPVQVLGALGPPAHLADGSRPGGLGRSLGAAWLDGLAETGARIVVWNRQVSAGSIELAHQRGLKVWIYTIDDRKRAVQLLKAGADGIITNRISVIREAVVKHLSHKSKPSCAERKYR